MQHKNINRKLTFGKYNVDELYMRDTTMSKKFILTFMAIGILTNGIHNDVSAMNKTAKNQQIQERVLTRKDAKGLIKQMKERGSTKLVIPNTFTSIDERAFLNFNEFTSVIIPDSVTSIGENAFYECEGLTSITIPNSVTSIEKSAFDECKGLTKVTIPNSVKYIGEYAFSGCDGAKFYIASEEIANKLRDAHYIVPIQEGRIYVNGKAADPENAWRWPEDGHLKFPKSVTSLNAMGFVLRRDIKSVTIPNRFTYIGYMAFDRCTELTSIKIPDSVTDI